MKSTAVLLATIVATSHGFSPRATFTPRATSSVLSMTVEQTDTKKTIKVGVIGMGRIGIVHLEAISKAPGVTPIIVQNPTISKAEAAAKTYNIPKVTSDPMDVITDPEVDAVWICSPSQFHADQIKACAAYKKHVFCEKPIATDLTETVEAINACSEAGVKLMIGLQRRFDQNFMRVREAVQAKEVGEPIVIKLCSRDPSPPPFSYVKGGGGLFTDMAVHGK
jgi:myo-inositol 2-dehydrogenase/D-chiro-inositol 1-dehydrogenase